MIRSQILVLILGLLAAVPVCATAVQPRIVVQANLFVEVAAWTADDKFIITADSTTRNVTIWDVEKRVVLDRLTLQTPAGWGNDLLYLEGIEIAPDSRSALIYGHRFAVLADQPDRQQVWRIDLETRRAEAVLPAKTLGTEKHLERWQDRLDALQAIYESGSTMTAEQAVNKLPHLPVSHDGKWRLERIATGLRLIGPGVTRTIEPKPPLGFRDAAMAPSGRRLALVVYDESKGATNSGTLVRTYDPISGRSLRWQKLAADYGLVRWLDNDLMLLTQDDTDDGRAGTEDANSTPPSSPAVVDAATGATMLTFAPRCYTTVMDGSAVGAGLSHCRAIKGDRDLWIADDKWTRLPDLVPAGVKVDLLEGSPAGKRLAMASELADRTVSLLALDFDHPDKSDELVLPKGSVITALRYSADGKSLFVAGNGIISRWQPGVKTAAGGGLPAQDYGIGSLKPQMIVSDGRTLVVSSAIDSLISRYDLATGNTLPPYDLPNAIAGGFIADRGLFWAVSYAEGLRLWDNRTGEVLLTTYFFDNDRYFVVTPEGRYDTNLGPDARQFRWLVTDHPWQSLAPQTFMRDFYEPKLTQRLLACRTTHSCDKAFVPLPAIEKINRVLPVVKIDSIVPGSTTGTAVVSLSAKQGVDTSWGGEKHSGLYNLRLFRGGQLVGQYPPNPADTAAADVHGWRDANRLPEGPDGVARTTFTVRVATGPTAAKPYFTAYAFNNDRIKGDTAGLVYQRPPVTPRPRRAFVLTIGINDYAEPRLHLNYAAADANLLSDRLSTIPDRDVRRLALTGEPGAPHATKALIAAALAILAGENADAARAKLTAAGVDASSFDTATPDDLLILSFAGHGWAAQDNEFFLIPSDGRWPDGAADPDRTSLISAGELTAWLRGVDAGEMAFIIDACQSAAAVRADGFKPGPMGDRGLGQLAYDKRIRILAATQSSAVALEDSRLGHGLLTWALAGEGVDAAGYGSADSNRDGTITLDEWLGYAARRLPKMSDELAKGTLTSNAAGRGFIRLAAGARPATQEPELFNFIAQPSPVVLRAKVAAH